jgi:hypothetical protein
MTEEVPTLSDVRILKPQVGDSLTADNNYTIEWSNPEIIESMDLFFTIDSGKTWLQIIYKKKYVTGKYEWKVPNITSDNCMIKIIAYENNRSYEIVSKGLFSTKIKDWPLGQVKLLKPNGGETFYANTSDTIKWSHPEAASNVDISYSTNYGSNWASIISNVNILTGNYLWNVPNIISENVKVKIVVEADGYKRELISEKYFSIKLKSAINIINPKGNQIYNNPSQIEIEWEGGSEVDKYKIYYSKYYEDLGTSLISSKWFLIDDNISGDKKSYNWNVPKLYNNKVAIKIISETEGRELEVISKPFSVYHDEVLDNEKQYQEKYSVGNKWVYFEKKNYSWEDDEYYIVNEVIGDKVENGIKYYNVLHKVFKDSVIISNSWVADRENYSPIFVMQNESYTNNSVWGYYFASVYDINEMVFSNQQIVKQYYWKIAESGNSEGKYKRGKDIGIFYYYSLSEGNILQKDLVGAYIDGVLYGDTTIVR